MMNFAKREILIGFFKRLQITQDTQVLKKIWFSNFINSVIFMNVYLLFLMVAKTFIIRSLHRKASNSENRTIIRNVSFNK